MAREVVIVGGGLAGMSAAIEALRRGWRPIVLEKTKALGGRSRSFYAADVDSMIDNGQHVLATNYRHTRQMLCIIGSEKRITFHSRLKIGFAFKTGEFFSFRSAPLPSPFHFSFPLIRSNQMKRPDRRALLKLFRNQRLERSYSLSSTTVHEWLAKNEQTPFLTKFLWEPLTVATLNTPLKEASALLLKKALDQTFLHSPFRCGLGLPNKFLGDIFAGPAEKFILENGGSIHTLSPVTRLFFENEHVKAVQTKKHQIVDTPELILAIPPRALYNILKRSGVSDSRFMRNLTSISYSPIITIHFWVKRKLPCSMPVAWIDSPIQWLFAHPSGARNNHGFGYSLVISAAFAQKDLTAEDIMQLTEQEFRLFFKKSLLKDYGLQQWKVIKEKQATVLQNPSFMSNRPSTRSPFTNLYLAGDWVDTALPATIESAVLSGKMAVDNLPR